MGWLPYRGIMIRTGTSGWDSYWKSQTSTLLFFGQTKNISGGRLNNEMSGSSDYLTVGGSAGSYTFQCPNTAAYIAADAQGAVDYIWFKSDASQRTPTEAELIGYDFARTIVYYDDLSDYTIRAIAILKPAGSVSNMMRNNFHLSVWWDGTLSASGYLKGNRGAGKTTWIPESTYPSILADGNTTIWLDYTEASTMTVDGSNIVTEWRDYLGNGNHLGTTAGGLLTADGILFNGTSQFLGHAFTLIQPCRYYYVFRAKSWTASDVIITGSTIANCYIQQNDVTPKLRLASNGMATYTVRVSPTLDSFVIVRAVFNGASSSLRLNAETAATGNMGTDAPNGIYIGARAGGDNNWANIEVKGLIVRKIIDGASDDTAIYDYLVAKYSIS